MVTLKIYLHSGLSIPTYNKLPASLIGQFPFAKLFTGNLDLWGDVYTYRHTVGNLGTLLGSFGNWPHQLQFHTSPYALSLVDIRHYVLLELQQSRSCPSKPGQATFMQESRSINQLPGC